MAALLTETTEKPAYPALMQIKFAGRN